MMPDWLVFPYIIINFILVPYGFLVDGFSKKWQVVVSITIPFGILLVISFYIIKGIPWFCGHIIKSWTELE